METILQNLTMMDSGKAEANHPLVVALGSRGHFTQTFVTVAGHAVPINRGGLTTAYDRMFKLYVLLNMQYPSECKQILHFLQRTVYGISDDLTLSRAANDLFLFIRNKKSQGLRWRISTHAVMQCMSPVWGKHSCIDCLLSMRILLPRTRTREQNLTIFTFFLSWHCAMCKSVNCHTMSWTWCKTASHRVNLLYRIERVWSDLVLVKALT